MTATTGNPPFLQQPPRAGNRFRGDRALRHGLERLLPPELYRQAAAEVDAVAERATAELPALAEQAEADPPRHVPYDAWGRRCDRIEVSPAWRELVALGQELGLVALPYEERYGPWARVVQAVLAQVYGPVSAMALCPITMTDGAVAALTRHDPALAARYVPRLTARSGGWTAGQWMTETAGGSDVSRTATVARPAGDGRWRLYGTKWFTSATTTDIALALARAEEPGRPAEPGSRGLSLFLLELREAGGGWNGLRVRRLKDKLGTRALPTAELELDGTVAVPVGGLGRGVPKVAAVLQVARLWAAHGAVGTTGYALALARDYARRREAFGRPLADHPAHRAWIARVAAVYEAMVALSLRAAEAVGHAEPVARVLVPLTKLACARQAVWATSELVESFGGAGYLEDTGIPRLLRDVHVHCIWEGTTTILALDVLRALRDPEVGEAFAADLDARVAAAQHPALAGGLAAVRAAAGELRRLLAVPPEEAGARRLAWGMARTYQAALLASAARWALEVHGDARAATAARVFCAGPLLDPPDPDGADLGELAFS